MSIASKIVGMMSTSRISTLRVLLGAAHHFSSEVIVLLDEARAYRLPLFT